MKEKVNQYKATSLRFLNLLCCGNCGCEEEKKRRVPLAGKADIIGRLNGLRRCIARHFACVAASSNYPQHLVKEDID